MQKVEATGTVQPVDSVEVGSQVTGTVNSLGATFNSVVHEGQVLATLDPAALQAQVDQARAALCTDECRPPAGEGHALGCRRSSWIALSGSRRSS